MNTVLWSSQLGKVLLPCILIGELTFGHSHGAFISHSEFLTFTRRTLDHCLKCAVTSQTVFDIYSENSNLGHSWPLCLNLTFRVFDIHKEKSNFAHCPRCAFILIIACW